MHMEFYPPKSTPPENSPTTSHSTNPNHPQISQNNTISVTVLVSSLRGPPSGGLSYSSYRTGRLEEIHVIAQNRAVTAETLSLSLVEYVTLTRENYRTAEYYSIAREVNPFPPPQLGSYCGFNSPKLRACSSRSMSCRDLDFCFRNLSISCGQNLLTSTSLAGKTPSSTRGLV